MKPLIIIACTLLVLTGFVSAQDKTEVQNSASARMLLGRHRLSLQWVSWDYFGVATVKINRGIYTLTGEQEGRGASKGNFVTIDGVILRIDAKEFKFRGSIVTRVDHINGGQPCERDGEFTFKITGKRRYWRLQQMDNPFDPVTDYVDIYLR